ncbi:MULTISPECIES: antibiotic biosynthesis monooxygenase family protein [Bacillus]|uniref:Antibiotic biosynthesis monooxygenase n=2 Tax=Bacillus TaxID=1386 RepID=A0A0M3RAP9_9BACI|nr:MULTISPECIES: antibiotic biosynthesis monooxygenase family protein [Bacillus]ALC83542.1 antibiotic biosynthesis monooxygenase [Bacillus gobiensis]MBP1082525.1 quinol monooxygenase YgiN [Bacillus capparidis]MED1097242.1 antibiotic biosynthesis monooxygenase [Bacillus capparidis]
MTTISTEHPCVTLINVFTVDPDRQEELVALLIQATESVMKKFPGFLSANFHQSLDGTKVVNYAQWKDEEAFSRMLKDPEALVHMKKAEEIAEQYDPTLYQVVYTSLDI